MAASGAVTAGGGDKAKAPAMPRRRSSLAAAARAAILADPSGGFFRRRSSVTSALRPRPFNLMPVQEFASAHRSDVRGLCAHGDKVASVGYDGLLHLWDLTYGDAPVASLSQSVPGRLFAVCDVPSLQLLATGGLDGAVRLWDPRQGGDCVATLEGHQSSVSSLVARGQHAELFSGGGDEHVLVWDVRAGQGTGSLRGQATSTRCMVFGGDAQEVLFMGGGDGQVRAWDCERDTRTSAPAYNAVEVLRGPLFAVSAICYHGPQSALAAGGMDNVVYCWDMAAHSTFTPEGRVRAARHVLKGHEGVINAVSAWGEQWLVSAGADGTLKLWDLESPDPEHQAPRRTFRPETDGEPTASIRCMHVVDGTRLCTGSADGAICVWLRMEPDESTGSGA